MQLGGAAHERRKQFRAVATSCDKLAVRYEATITVADIFIWLRARPDKPVAILETRPIGSRRTVAMAARPSRRRLPLAGFASAIRRVWRWVGASWRNLVTVVLLGLAAPVGVAAGWDPQHRLQWLVAAAVIAVLGALAQLPRGVSPSVAPPAAMVTIGKPHSHPPHFTAQPGAARDHNGTNFAVFSKWAEAVELCLFDEAGNERRV
jgi:hypothetical protein